MSKKNIYIGQIGTGSNINLLPLAAGQLAARLKREKDLLEEFPLGDLLFRREDPETAVAKLNDVFVLGLSCFLWNLNHSLELARAVRNKFPDALIVLGGPSIPKEPADNAGFFRQNPFINLICLGEGEEVFAQICRRRAEGKDFDDITGLIGLDRKTGKVYQTGPEETPDMEMLPSPFLDGTFDAIYPQYAAEFSGTILETNRGCPYRCSYCTWGNQPSKIIREKPDEIVRREIEWIGRNKIRYIAMSDANFGIRRRDLDFVHLLAECKAKYGVPNFISVSWAKNSSDKVLAMSDILKKGGIGFRVTLSLQSLNDDCLRAINRINIRREDYIRIKDAYRKDNLYSYTELIFGLPMETRDSYLDGIERSLSPSVFDQLYIYPLFLFPNTQMALSENRTAYGIKSRKVPCVYTKSKDTNPIREFVEIVVGSAAMPEDHWVDCFILGYLTLALHDDRPAFFILNFLKKEYGLRAIDLVRFAHKISTPNTFPVLHAAFQRLERTARSIQENSTDHLIRPRNYGGIPYDPPDGIFLELVLQLDLFYDEFYRITEAYLKSQNIACESSRLKDLFQFQNAVMAHLDGKPETELELRFNWIDYFACTFHQKEETLRPVKTRLKVVDIHPCGGDPVKYLKNHFDIRGIPAFNLLIDQEGRQVFPPVDLQSVK